MKFSYKIQAGKVSLSAYGGRYVWTEVSRGRGQCPLSGVGRWPLLGGSLCTSSMGISIGGMKLVRCMETVHCLESMLLDKCGYSLESLLFSSLCSCLYYGYTSCMMMYISFAVAITIVTNPVDSAILSPTPIMLSCTASGVPRPVITWTRDDGTMNTTLMDGINNVSIITLFNSAEITASNLTILSSKPSDTATYTCSANNTESMATSSPARVEVFGEWYHVACL